jgi:hypothetical protein
MHPPNPSHRQATAIPRQTPNGKNRNNANSLMVKCDRFIPSPKAKSSTIPTTRMLNTLADHRRMRSETGRLVIELFVSFIIGLEYLVLRIG